MAAQSVLPCISLPTLNVPPKVRCCLPELIVLIGSLNNDGISNSPKPKKKKKNDLNLKYYRSSLIQFAFITRLFIIINAAILSAIVTPDDTIQITIPSFTGRLSGNVSRHA